MLRNVSQGELNWGTIDVFLKDGSQYLRCDYPQPFISDSSPSVVSFWYENKLYNVPITLVNSVILNPPE